ncbi:MAG: flagellar basal-body MS-ring/collar protein FliF [Actinomycetales bacterium]
MKSALGGSMQRFQRMLAGFTTGQRTVTVLAVIGLVLGAMFFSKWASAPSMSPLFSNLSTTDASAIVDKLTSSGTPYQLADGGTTILVPQDKVYSARLAMSGQGLPAGSESGYALLDKQGLTTSEFQQQVGYQRALEGELTKTLEALSGVRTAVVHLAIPQKDVFTQDSEKPTASVLLDMQPGTQLASQQVQAVVNLVASSVAGMTPDNVTVADSKGGILTAAGQTASSAAGDARAQQTADWEQRTGDSLQAMLDKVLGPNHAFVKVTADLDYDATDTKTTTYVNDPKVPPLADSTTKETFKGTGGASASGILGNTTSGTLTGTPSGSAGTTDYTKETVTRNNSVGEVVQTRKTAPGSVRKLNVGVLVDSSAGGTAQAQKIQALIASAIGIDPKRGDTIQVTALPFDKTVAAQTAKELKAAQAATSQAGMMNIAKTAGLALLVLAVLVLAFLSSRKKRTALSPEELVRLETIES